MTYEETIAEITASFGLVPSFMQYIPKDALPAEWAAMKNIQLAPGHIPPKYKELIGVGISSVTHCRYCAYFHTEVAKVFGATQEEIEEAIRYAKSSAGWSAYINGTQADFDSFKKEINQACDHVRAGMAAGAAG